MLEFVTFPPAFGLRNVSPFCLKVEMLLTSLELPFTLAELSDPRKAPKGKLPYLVVDGQKIADSELITQYLDGVTNGEVYRGLSPEQKAHGVALARLVEDHLYWLMVASRWLDEDWWPHVVQGFFGAIPGILRPLIAGIPRRQIAKTLDLHGLGRHTLEQQRGFARRDLEALEAAVPGDGFLFGERPGIFDFTIAGLMAGIYDNQPATWVTDIAAEYEGLRAYTERVQEAVGVWGRK
jgi:glutathione S-transferase